jgi:flagellar assembly protein FliH
MKTPRPHRFPPLAHFSQGAVPLAGQTGAQLQASLAQGFQEGLAKGYEEGYASGLQTGQDEARAAAQAAGHADGLAEARRDAAARLAGPLEAAGALQEHLRRLQHDYQAAMRREVVELVERVARQVIRAELTLRPAQLLALVDETLASMPPARDGVEVFLHPDDRQRLMELVPDRLRGWTIHADAALDAGECRVIAGGREADAGCRQRLSAVMTQVRGQLVEEGTPAAGHEAAETSAVVEGAPLATAAAAGGEAAP